MKKYGSSEPVLDDEDDNKKVASKNWTEQDTQELRQENAQADGPSK